MARLIVTLLGGFRARLDPATPLALPTRKAQALLAYLALPPGTPHPRDKLASLLWGNTVETTARTSLRQTLYALRRCLREADPRPLAADGETVALDPNAVTVDVREFELRAAEATPSALAEAAALYQGDFLEGLAVQEQPFEDWLLGHRERLREVALKSLVGLLAHQRAAGSTDSAVQTALRLLALDPLQEPVHRALMQLYAETGRRGSALRQYQRCVATLQQQLRTEPEAETKALYHEILRRRRHVMPDEHSQPIRAVTAEPTSHHPELTEPPPAWEPPLVGRQREVALLTEALDGALAGRGRLVVLIGEAGAGKSRLVSELMVAATRRRGRVLVGRCYETERILPFGPWVDALRSGHVVEERQILDTLEPGWRDGLGRLLPELSTHGTATASSSGGDLAGRIGGDPRYPFEAISELLKRLTRRQLLVVVLEDAHWADEMSVRLLAFLGRRLHEVPLLVVATVREEELADVALLRQSLDELEVNGELMRLSVPSLSRADTVALVQALAAPGLPDQLVAHLAQDAWRISDGNAFVVVEVMHALREGQAVQLAQRLPLPARVRRLVQQRLERLTDRGRRLVAAAAVIGRQFDFALVQRAAGMSEREAAEGVEELVRQRVLRGAGDGLEFSHDHIREVTTSELAPPLRVALHRRVAESLEEVYGHDLAPHALALGTHYRNGQAWEKAAAFLHMAGRQAATRSAHHHAVACFEEALTVLRRLPPSREVDDRDVDVRIELRQSLYPMGRFADLIRHLREGERIAEKLEDRPRLARLSAYVSNHAWITGDLPQALASGRRALALAEALANGGLAVEANFRLGQVHWSLGQYREALSFFERCGTAQEPPGAAARYGPSGWPTEFGLAELSLYYIAAPLMELGRFDEALAAGRRALEFARRMDRPFALVGSFAAIGRALLYRGRFGEAAAALTRGLELCRRWEFSVHRPWLAAALGHTYALAGRVSKGLSILRAAVDEAERLGNVGGHAWRLASLGEALLLAGRQDEAATRAEQALQQSRLRGERGHEAWALRLQAEVAASPRSPARDVAHERFHEALALAGALEMRPLEARCHLGLAALHHAEGRRDEASTAREHAIEMLRSMGMDFWLTQAERLPLGGQHPARRD
jgi:DNA-binding SARP family transcriptional activator/tetratricopeptide (TPR) repeat protein/ABC-type cobalamin/Fe3+-siderophores transport system ATPase subunit